MAHIIDASVLGRFRGPDVGRTFSNILTDVGRIDQLRQGREQSSRARAEQGLRSIAIFGAEVSPMLETGDIEGAKATTRRRIAQLEQQGVPTDESRQFLDLLDTNPELAKQRAGQAAQLGQRLGILRGQDGQAGLTAGTREFQALVKAGGLTPKEIEKAARIKIGIDARASNFGERLQFEINKQRDAGNIKVEQQLRKTAGDLGIKLELDPKIAAKTAEAQLPALQRRETIKANSKRISFLSDDQRKRDSSISKARQFLKPLQEGRAFSGVTRTAASFIPGVFTSQAQFDEKFNAFAEVAARQQLKASGEIRPTDADVEGMKRAMFGVGRDEQVNVELLQEFIEDQQALNDELQDLTSARTSGRLDTFDIQQQRTTVQPAQRQLPVQQPVQQTLQQPAQPTGQFNSASLGRVVTEQEIQDTLNANPGLTREQLFQQLGIQ